MESWQKQLRKSVQVTTDSFNRIKEIRVASLEHVNMAKQIQQNMTKITTQIKIVPMIHPAPIPRISSESVAKSIGSWQKQLQESVEATTEPFNRIKEIRVASFDYINRVSQIQQNITKTTTQIKTVPKIQLAAIPKINSDALAKKIIEINKRNIETWQKQFQERAEADHLEKDLFGEYRKNITSQIYGSLKNIKITAPKLEIDKTEYSSEEIVESEKSNKFNYMTDDEETLTKETARTFNDLIIAIKRKGQEELDNWAPLIQWVKNIMGWIIVMKTSYEALQWLIHMIHVLYTILN